jgi:hypothetical protein
MDLVLSDKERHYKFTNCPHAPYQGGLGAFSALRKSASKKINM